MNKLKIVLIFGLSFFAKDLICEGKIIFINLSGETVKTRVEYDGKDDISSGRELVPYGFSVQDILGTFDKLRISFCKKLLLDYQKAYMGKQYSFSGAVFNEIKKEKIVGKDILVIVGDVNYYEKEARVVKQKISKQKDDSAFSEQKDDSTLGKRLYDYGEKFLDSLKSNLVSIGRTSKSKINLDDYFINEDPVGKDKEIVYSTNKEKTFRGAIVILDQKYNLVDLIKQIESIDVEYDHLKQLFNKKSIKDYFEGVNSNSNKKKELYLKFDNLYQAFGSSKTKIIKMIEEFLNKVSTIDDAVKIKLFLSDKINKFMSEYFEVRKFATSIFGEFFIANITKEEEPKEEIKIKEELETFQKVLPEKHELTKVTGKSKDTSLLTEKPIEKQVEKQDTDKEELIPNLDEFVFEKDKPKNEDYDKDLSLYLNSRAEIDRLYFKYREAIDSFKGSVAQIEGKAKDLWKEYLDKYFTPIKNELNKIQKGQASKYNKDLLIESVLYFNDAVSDRRKSLQEMFEGLVDFPGAKKSVKKDLNKSKKIVAPIANKISNKELLNGFAEVKLKLKKTGVIKEVDRLARYKELLEKEENGTLSKEEKGELSGLKQK